MENFWDKRYSLENYVYGIKPNKFIEEVFNNYSIKGDILFPGEGEGRNAVYAAKEGLNVFAFDTSKEGKNKALLLAKREDVVVDYQIGDLLSTDFKDKKFDAIVLIYAHFSKKIHENFINMLKPNGLLIIEGFSKDNLKLKDPSKKNTNGPGKIEMLYSIEEMKRDFSQLEILKNEEKEIFLDEGEFHKGKSLVIRFIGKK